MNKQDIKYELKRYIKYLNNVDRIKQIILDKVIKDVHGGEDIHLCERYEVVLNEPKTMSYRKNVLHVLTYKPNGDIGSELFRCYHNDYNFGDYEEISDEIYMKYLYRDLI